MTDSIHVQGEGGTVIKMDLPLPEHIAQRLTTGQLRRINEDGTPFSDSTSQPLAPGSDPVPGPPLTEPAKTAVKADWVGWAVVCGANVDEAEGMTKNDLIEKYAARP